MTNARRSLRNCDVAAEELLEKKGKKKKLFFRWPGRLLAGQTQLCWRALGRGYLDWMVCKVRIVWTRLICRARAPCVSCGGGFAMEVGGAGRGPNAPVKTRIWRVLPPASHVSPVDRQRAGRLPFTLLRAQTLPSKKKPKRRNSLGAVSGVALLTYRLSRVGGSWCWTVRSSGGGRLNVNFIQLLRRGGLASEMCFCEISL